MAKLGVKDIQTEAVKVIRETRKILGDKSIQVVPTTVRVPAGTASGKLFRLKDKGARVLQKTDRGDHYVELVVSVPEKLSRQQRKLLEELNRDFGVTIVIVTHEEYIASKAKRKVFIKDGFLVKKYT